MRALLLIWSLAPLLWQLYTSFQPPEALVAPAGAAAAQWTLENYRQILSGDPPFWRYLLNSTVVGAATTVLTLLLAVPCAYGLQRQRGPCGWGFPWPCWRRPCFPPCCCSWPCWSWPGPSGWPTTSWP
jgi:multiple sugar transport system permease protein